ncbi:hypothetical protein Lal_00043447 [Lupinus albus]|nr:hypothetical protein Lal_00043447 [Lupinus albus]
MGRTWSNQSAMFSCRLVLGKCSVEVPPGLTVQGWLLRGSLGIVVASTEARCSRKVVVLGEPFLGVSAAPCMGQVPKHPEVHPGLFNTVGAWGGRGRINQQCFSCRLVPRESVLLRCRPGLTVQSWFVAGSLGIVVPSTVARSARKVVVLGEPFMGIYAEHEGAGELPAAHAPWWVRMACHGAPPSAPASFPKHAGAFFHGDVGNSTESKIVHAESRSYVSRFWLVQRKNVGIS